MSDPVISLFGGRSRGAASSESNPPSRSLSSKSIPKQGVPQNLKQKIGDLKTQLAKKDQEIVKLQEQNASLMITLQGPTVQRTFHEKMKADLQFQIEIKNDTIEKLAKENEQLKQRLNTEGGAFKTEYNGQKEISEDKPQIPVSELNKIKEILELELDKIKQEKDHLAQSTQDLEKEVKLLRKRHQNDEKIILQQQITLKEYSQSHSDTKTLSQEVRILASENSELKAQNMALSESLQVLASRVEELTVTLDRTIDVEEKPSRSKQEQENLNMKFRKQFPALEVTENVIECFSTTTGFMYITSSYVCFEAVSTWIQATHFYKIIDIASLNKLSSTGILPIPTLEFRLLNGDLKRYPGFSRRCEAMILVYNRAIKLQHSIQLYDFGQKVEDPALLT